jgi:putative transposase
VVSAITFGRSVGCRSIVLLCHRDCAGFNNAKHLHFVTFSCYRPQPKLGTAENRDAFERSLERVRQQYRLYVTGYVVMPEHVHLLLSEPPDEPLSKALQSLKQSVARTVTLRSAEPFWLERYYDFNVYTEAKRVEKLRYMHRNPVKRGLVAAPEDWPWSSFRHWATGVEGVVEIESNWTARRREQMGMVAPELRFRGDVTPS